jgi:hypothetical protein
VGPREREPEGLVRDRGLARAHDSNRRTHIPPQQARGCVRRFVPRRACLFGSRRAELYGLDSTVLIQRFRLRWSAPVSVLGAFSWRVSELGWHSAAPPDGSGMANAPSSAPGLCEGSDTRWREPERVDDAKVLEATFGAGLAKEVLWHVEASCRLCRSKEVMVPSFVKRSFVTADHRLTKILVLAWCRLHGRSFCVGLWLERFCGVATP